VRDDARGQVGLRADPEEMDPRQGGDEFVLIERALGSGHLHAGLFEGLPGERVDAFEKKCLDHGLYSDPCRPVDQTGVTLWTPVWSDVTGRRAVPRCGPGAAAWSGGSSPRTGRPGRDPRAGSAPARRPRR